MVKKLFSKIALAIMIGVMTTPIVFAGKATDALGDIAAVYSDVKPCIQELLPNQSDPTNPTDGPDNGYVISVIEAPLNVDESGEGTDYVIRRCFRNTFQFHEDIPVEDGKDANGQPKTKTPWVPKSVSMLSKTCSNKAQGLMTENKDNELKVYSCKEVQVILTKGGTSDLRPYKYDLSLGSQSRRYYCRNNHHY
jgi:hypothetical protein